MDNPLEGSNDNFPTSKSFTIKGRLNSMKIGETIDFPAEKTSSIRQLASVVGFESGKVFKTTTNRKSRKISVRRFS